jgi:hypothetical protein
MEDDDSRLRRMIFIWASIVRDYQERFCREARGTVYVKGKGKMEAWQIHGI